MRIALDATSLIGRLTGVGVFTRELARGLADHPEIDLDLFAVTWRGRDALAAVAPPGATVHARPAAARPLRWMWERVAFPPAEWWAGAADVVHGPNYVVPPARHAATVVTVHDLTPVHFPELCTDDTRRYPRLVQTAIDRGAWVHADSEFVAAEVRDAFRVDPDRVVAVPLGVSAPAPVAAGAGRRLVGDRDYVLAVGTIEPRKDHPLLVEAFDRFASDHPDVVLAIAGQDGWGVEPFEAAVAAATHRDRIVRLGYVSDRDRAALLAEARVLAFATRYEGFGLPPLEAMAAGTPVVASDVGAVHETAGDAARLVPAGDPDAFATALADVVDDASVAAAMVERGRARVGAFTWSRTVDGIVSLYERALGARPAQQRGGPPGAGRSIP